MAENRDAKFLCQALKAWPGRSCAARSKETKQTLSEKYLSVAERCMETAVAQGEKLILSGDTDSAKAVRMCCTYMTIEPYVRIDEPASSRPFRTRRNCMLVSLCSGTFWQELLENLGLEIDNAYEAA